MNTQAVPSLCRALCLLGVTGFLGSAEAATVSYTGPSMGTWSTPSFWSGGSVPATGDSVRIFSSSASDFFVSGNVSASLSSLDIDGAGSRWTILAMSKNLTVTGDARLGTNGLGSIEQNGGNNRYGQLLLGTSSTTSYGYYTLFKGNVSAGNLTIGSSGIGTFDHKKGNVTVDNVLTIGNGTREDSLYSLYNGKLTVGSASYIGANGDGFFQQAKGSASFGNLTVGHAAGIAGSVKLYGGSIQSTSTILGNQGEGYFEQYGGAHTVAGNLSLGAMTGGGGAYTLQNGTLNVGGQIIVGGQGEGLFFQLGGSVTAGQGVNVGLGEYQLKNATLTTRGLSVGAGSYLTTEGTKATIRTSGDIAFDSAATVTTRDATLFITKGSHISLSAIQSDTGASASALSGAESWNAITLEKKVTLTLDGTAGTDAIYVDTLNIGSKKPTQVESLITGNGVNMYYNADLKANKYLKGGTYDLINGGQLIPVFSSTVTGTGSGAGLQIQGAGSLVLSGSLTYGNVSVATPGKLTLEITTSSGEFTFELPDYGTFDPVRLNIGTTLTFADGPAFVLVDKTGLIATTGTDGRTITGGTWEQINAAEEPSGTLATSGFSGPVSSTVPEPTSALLALFGATALLARRTRR